MQNKRNKLQNKMQKKQTFESVLRECGFTQNGNCWYLVKGLYAHFVKVVDSSMCDYALKRVADINYNTILNGYIRRPERLKVLIDILLETR
jgi:hypothetical protein